MRIMMKSKIHRATVTGADVNYEGSITIDPLLMEAADILPFEQVHVVDVDNGARLVTYAIEGTAGKGEIVLNGAAARLVNPGDIVIIIGYQDVADADARAHKPRLVYVDSENKIVRTAHDIPLGAGV
jgi:aspartate 1-decarboxylase